MNIRYSLLALSALACPLLRRAQYAPAVCLRPRHRRTPCVPPPRSPSRGWRRRLTASSSQGAVARSAGPTRGALEPIDLPPAIEQGIDMIYIDEELVPRAVQTNGPMCGLNFADWSGAPVDLFASVNPIYTELRRGLDQVSPEVGRLPAESRFPPGRR